MTDRIARRGIRAVVPWGAGVVVALILWSSSGAEVTAGTNPKPGLPGQYKWVPFGKLDTLYHVGDWVVLFWSKHTKNLYAWYGKRAEVVIEMVRAANGWWHWRKKGNEKIVWSDGSASRQTFDKRPWIKSLGGMVQSATKVGAKVAFKGSSGTTTFEVIKGGLQITTPDNGVLTLGRNSAVIKHLVYNKSKTVYHQ